MSGASTQDGTAGDDPGFRVTVADATRRGFEPSLALSPDGSIWVCAPHAVGRGSDLWVSEDEGASFRYVGTPLVPSALPLPPGPVLRSGTGDLGGGDCDVGADAGGRVYLVDGWVGSVSVSSSTDRGATWRGTPLSIPGGPLDRPWVLGGEKDEVFVTAAQIQGTGLDDKGLNTPPVGGIWVTRSTDGGLTFSVPVLAVGNENRIGLNSNLARAGDDLYLMYTKKVAEGRLAIMVAVSSDLGKKWEQRVVAEQRFFPRQCSPLDTFPVVAADGAGGVYLAWVIESPETERADLFLAASPDGGKTWNAPVPVTDRAGSRAMPWIATSGPGKVGLVWYETNVTALTKLNNLACQQDAPPDAAWHIHYASSSNAVDPQPTFQERLVQPEPIHSGPLDRPYAEVLQVRFTPDGRAATAYVADVPEGVARPMFAIQDLEP